ncbi:MAG TPA: hypothetical protein VHE34_11110 [Puia sp.]|uniref:hypothetical protein n=1 Tax=Puia sp. TaxID=2045100 RepID=UPI002C720E3D|nr:hypothetical protein [Puia sp.]HVU95766.1 hypothetical protein [Puia sp.]
MNERKLPGWGILDQVIHPEKMSLQWSNGTCAGFKGGDTDRTTCSAAEGQDITGLTEGSAAEGQDITGRTEGSAAEGQDIKLGEIFERIEKEFVEFAMIWHKIKTKNRYSQALRDQL